MKKFLAFFLALIMVCSLCISAMAADAEAEYQDEGENLATAQEIYKQAEIFAQAKGLQLLPEEVVFASSANNSETIPPASAPSKVAKPSSSITVTEGKGSTQTLTANGEKWFTFKTTSGGAYNIYTTGSTNTYGELYKSGLLGLSLVTKTGTGGSNNNFQIKVDLNNNTTYYVKVKGGTSSSSGSFRFYFVGNRDSKTSSNGGEWRWSKMDVDPDGAFFNIDQITYLTPTQATGYYNVVSTDNIRKVRDAVINLTTTKAIEWIMKYYGVNADVAKWILDILAVGSAVVPQIPSLTSVELDSIAKAAARDASTGMCSKGLIVYSVTTYTSTGSGGMIPVTMNTYERWNGTTMYGQKYYRGTFSLPANPKPLWR